MSENAWILLPWWIISIVSIPSQCHPNKARLQYEAAFPFIHFLQWVFPI